MIPPMDSPVDGRTTVVENPSADKFGPPAAPSDARPEGKFGRQLKRVVFGVVVYSIARELWPGSGGRAWLPGIVVLAISFLDLVMQHLDKIDEKEPYSPPTHITR